MYTATVSSPVRITAFYAFTPIPAESLPSVRADLLQFGAGHGMRGLTLIADEGINGTVCGTPAAVDAWKRLIESRFGVTLFNDSEAEHHVFRKWVIKIKPEIVALKQDEVRPGGTRKHLTPEEWDSMAEREDAVIVDARNIYETAIGTFDGAIDPRTNSFHEFADFAASGSVPKDKKVLMYCTGGIRCEKALIEMEKNGYENVFQLRGGILAYLRAFPGGKFKGECFVFDERVSVDQELKPSSRYALCPHCGDPADRVTTCGCGKTVKVCAGCSVDDTKRACSKGCRVGVR